MTREQLIAMRDAARNRANDFDRKAREMHARRQFDAHNSIGTSYAVALTLAEMCDAALAVTE